MPPVKLGPEDASLIILPPLPSPLKRSSLWSAYKTTFETLLPKVLPHNKDYVSRLDVAVSLTSSRHSTSRTANYPQDQLIFQEIYTLICLAAARTNIELDFPGGIDARVFLLQKSPPTSEFEESKAAQQWLSGPVIDVPTLVSSRVYSSIYSPEGEQGESVLQSLLLNLRNLRLPVPPFHRLPSGPSLNQLNTPTTTLPSSTPPENPRVHHDVINGGTFDHLHLGHKLLLTATIYLSDPYFPPSSSSSSSSKSRSITIGTTGDELLVNKKHPSVLESWETRQTRVHEFLDSILNFSPFATKTTTSANLEVTRKDINDPGPNGKTVRYTYTLNLNGQPKEKVEVNYTQISDPFGPTITVEDLSALIVSAETRSGGKAVNDKRHEKGWEALEVFEVGVLDASVSEDQKGIEEVEGFEGKLSSTDIRRRLVDLEKEKENVAVNGGAGGVSGKGNGGEKL